MSEERFELHNFDVLMKGLEIKASIYRYFFTPPSETDKPVLREVIQILGEESFAVPIGGIRPLKDFSQAISDSQTRAFLGKQVFRMDAD